MSIVLLHHPFSRAANVVWMLEEAEVDYKLEYVDIMKGAQKGPQVTKYNAMGKLPTLHDGEAVVSESAAIALYLADRYAYGRLSPKTDDPRRGAYFRWVLYAPSVIEPGLMAHAAKWEFKPGQAGWGDYDAMIATMEGAVQDGYLLGKDFSMADCVFGGLMDYMLKFKMLESRKAFTDYVALIQERPAYKKAQAKNAEVMKEHDLKFPGS